MSERIQKILAQTGLGSRRKIESYIKDGRIKVNGKVAQLGDRMTVDDKILFDGKRIDLKAIEKFVSQVIVYNKPDGEVCSRSDEADRKTVFDNLPKIKPGRWISVGRLDINTQGLLLFTNDGELAARLMHPRYAIAREYAVRVLGEVTETMLDNLKAGVKLADGLAQFSSITFQGGEGANQWYHVTLQTGKNREVRRLWESQGVKVSRLIRIRFGDIIMPTRLRRGQSQPLDQKAINQLHQSVDLPGLLSENNTKTTHLAQQQKQGEKQRHKQRKKHKKHKKHKKPAVPAEAVPLVN